MTTRPSTRRIAGWATALLCAAAAPAWAIANPPILMAPQGIEYMCGGKDKAEMAFMQQVAPRWAATLEFGISQGPRGQFPVQAKVRVRDKYHGQVVLEAQSEGPFLLARLDPGTYDVEATLGGLTLTQSITVMRGVPARAHFLWPSNFDMASLLDPPQTHAQALAKGE